MTDTLDDPASRLSAREDLFDLAVRLRNAGLEASPAQLVEAHDLLLGLILAGALPDDRVQWAGYLAPIFCRSESEQNAFHQLFPVWANAKSKAIPPDPAPLSPHPAVTRAVEINHTNTRRWRYLATGLLALITLWITPSSRISVEQPVENPPVTQPKPGGEPNKAITPTQPKSSASQTVFPSRPPEKIPPQLSVGPVDLTSTQLICLATSSPLGLFFIWLIRSYIDRRTVLTKESGDGPEEPHTYWVKGADDGLFRPADLSFAAARFRDPYSLPSRRLHVRRTVAATVRQAGFYTPVYRRRRRHPEYVVLIDRASLPSPAAHAAAPEAARDHLAAYGEMLLDQFRAEQVITHVYHFDHDPRRCRPADGEGSALDLAALESRHGECRLIVLSDGAGLFEALSGRAVSWLDEFRRWPLRIVLTPKSVDEWGYAEGTLALNGFAVAPLHPRSLALLADLWLPLALRDDLTEAAMLQVRLLAPLEARIAALPESIQRHGDRWLESISPEGGPPRGLMDALQGYLGEAGMLLIKALAVYPELTWPLSLYVDWKLFPQSDPGERALRLLSLARLPWLRHGRMPEYLRLALVRRLPRQRHRRIVELYQTLLQAVDEQGPNAIALSIGPPPDQRFLSRLQAWLKREKNHYGDRIFAKVLLGGRPGWLDVELPDLIARLLPNAGWSPVAARLLAGFAGSVMAAIGIYAVFSHYQSPVDGWFKSRELARNGTLIYEFMGTDKTRWIESGLVDVLMGWGFKPAAELSLYPGQTWKPIWQESPTPIIVQTGDEAAAAGEWVAQRLRYLTYGQAVIVHRGSLDLSSEPNTEPMGPGDGLAKPSSDDAKKASQPGMGITSHTVGPRQILVWLADVPPVFQDSLTAKPTPIYIEPTMVEMPAGTFTMGSPTQEKGRAGDEGPQHGVSAARFALSVHEVTFDEYDAYAEATGRDKPKDQGWGRGKRPVINVSWNDAQAYAAWLSEKTGRSYRLPTEAEWEYAARAGTSTSRYWGDDPKERDACAYANVSNPRDADEMIRRYGTNAWVAFTCNDPFPFTAPVGSFTANKFELQDILGNVWEWVADCYHDNYQGAPSDGRAWEDKQGCESGRRVLRGGSWGNEPDDVRSANRSRNLPGSRYDNIGFRLARTL